MNRATHRASPSQQRAVDGAADFHFTIDQCSRSGLTDQLVSGIKDAIRSGRYKDGDRLPSREEIAARFGVSLHVPRQAFLRLKREGFLVTRPRLGSVVAKPSGSQVPKGLVLYVNLEADDAAYGTIVVAGELRKALYAANYQMMQVCIRQKTANSFDFSAVERSLALRPVLALVTHGHPKIRKWFESHDVPFQILGGMPKSRNCAGRIPAYRADASVAAFADHCVRAGVRNVWQVGFVLPGYFSVTAELERRGVSCLPLAFPPLPRMSRYEGIALSAYRGLLQALSEKRRPKPDLILFQDDYSTRGGLPALASAGFKIPSDVKVVTLVNHGNAPFYVQSLTAFVYDPKEEARGIVRVALEFLGTGRFASVDDLQLRYRIGETFP